ncbi:hypothetical protein ACH4TE_12025 [Streptomyces sioyaensis]|uniref:hypothetical protein n=1 Tax=Streptomyces sioyaensis TaxID=67364 RepID=UPI0037B6E67D
MSQLGDLATEDTRIHEINPHGSSKGDGASIDEWSDLDVLMVTPEPVEVAEAFAERIGSRLVPLFTSQRGGDSRRYTLRMVLVDLRRIDITAVVPTGVMPAGSGEDSSLDTAAAGENGAMKDLINDFRFDAVLAAVKAARDDILIGGHLTLQLARHVLVAAVLLRDREAGTSHHRFGGTQWDAWATVLGSAPGPYTRRDVTKAIRHYTDALTDLVTAWDPRDRPDNGPLLALLDAVDDSTRRSS